MEYLKLIQPLIIVALTLWILRDHLVKEALYKELELTEDLLKKAMEKVRNNNE